MSTSRLGDVATARCSDRITVPPGCFYNSHSWRTSYRVPVIPPPGSYWPWAVCDHPPDRHYGVVTEERTVIAMEHLHQDNYQLALDILIPLLGAKRELDGFRCTEHGVELDWEVLDHSPLSTTEKATIRLAHVIADFERHGGGFPGPAVVGNAAVIAVQSIRAT